MSPIRALERQDIPSVANLYQFVMRSGSPVAPPDLAVFFERTLLDHPWADSEIPSLVYLGDDGEIVGFIGSYVRRMRFDGKPIRMACSAHLVAHPGVRNRAVGAFLMKRYLAGPQDLTITNGASETVRRMWEGLGGETAHLSCLSWVQVFRPWRFASERMLGRIGGQRLNPLLRPVSSLLDAATARLAPAAFEVPRPDVAGEPLGPGVILEHLPALVSSLRLYPDYDRGYLEWLFGELAVVRTRWGPLVAGKFRRGGLAGSLVRRNGRVLGWYVYYLEPGGPSRVLQIVAGETDGEVVLHHLLHDASTKGAAAVYGRLEPRLFGALSARRPMLRFSEGRSLIQSRHPEITAAILAGDALLTRLEGEWW